jgi:Uma2 family endonuclease
MAMRQHVVPEPRRYSVAEVLEFPSDGNRYEVVAGELLVSPAPRDRHQLIILRLVVALVDYLRPLGLVELLRTSPADITWGVRPDEAEDLVQPDVFVMEPGQHVRDWIDVARLALAAEVLSPSTARGDRVVKRPAYQRHGVGTYWIVDDDAKLVEVWHPADERPAIVTDMLSWQLTEAGPGMRLAVEELFAEARMG